MIVRTLLPLVAVIELFNCMTIETFVASEIPWKKGLCKNEIQTLQSDFQAERFFSGTWYEGQSMGAFLTHISRKCMAVECEYFGKTVNLTLSEYIPIIFSTVRQRIQISLKDVKIPIFDIVVPWLGMTVVKMPVSILSTDYDNYALVYSCCTEPLGLEDYISEVAFVLRRKRGDKSKAYEIRAEAWKNGLVYEDFTSHDDESCPS